jgi:hypothetical protein
LPVSETSTAGSAENRRGTLIGEKALKVAEQFEQVGQRKLAPRTVRETLAELYREIYNETLPADWLHTKQPEASAGTLAFYKKSTAKFLEFLGTAAEPGSCLNNTDYRFGVQKLHREKNSPVTTNADLKAIKMTAVQPSVTATLRKIPQSL